MSKINCEIFLPVNTELHVTTVLLVSAFHNLKQSPSITHPQFLSVSLLESLRPFNKLFLHNYAKTINPFEKCLVCILYLLRHPAQRHIC